MPSASRWDAGHCPRELILGACVHVRIQVLSSNNDVFLVTIFASASLAYHGSIVLPVAVNAVINLNLFRVSLRMLDVFGHCKLIISSRVPYPARTTVTVIITCSYTCGHITEHAKYLLTASTLVEQSRSRNLVQLSHFTKPALSRL